MRYYPDYDDRTVVDESEGEYSIQPENGLFRMLVSAAVCLVAVCVFFFCFTISPEPGTYTYKAWIEDGELQTKLLQDGQRHFVNPFTDTVQVIDPRQVYTFHFGGFTYEQDVILRFEINPEAAEKLIKQSTR
jgi:hypothetical protein